MASSFDIDAFKRGLAAGGQKFLAAAALGVDRFAEHVVGDAQQMCPIDTGTLMGGGVKDRTAAEVAADIPIVVKDGSIHKEIGFNTNYAAAVHENLEARHTQGQAKFLSAALEANAPKAMPYIGSVVRQAGF